MIKILKIIRTAFIFFAVSSVYVNVGPHLLATPIEVMIILSGVWGLFGKSLYSLFAAPAFCGIIMSVFRGGALFWDAGLCALATFFVFFLNNKERGFNPLFLAWVFVFKTLLSAEFNFLFVAINTLIFTFMCILAQLIINRRIKGIF